MARAQRAEQDFEEFVYSVTHDLKSYARAIKVIPEWIEEDLSEAGQSFPDDVQDHISMLKTYASGLDRMLEALTTLSRVGRLADTPSNIDLNDALTRAWDSVPEAAGTRLTLPDTALAVHGPANDFQHLFRAILSNAVVHDTSGQPEVTVTARSVDGRARVSVADTGPGIAPEFRDRVFEPLHTLRPRDETGRAGMGLAIARKVVERSGGEISITDNPRGAGCVVTFDLPAAR